MNGKWGGSYEVTVQVLQWKKERCQYTSAETCGRSWATQYILKCKSCEERGWRARWAHLPTAFRFDKLVWMWAARKTCASILNKRVRGQHDENPKYRHTRYPCSKTKEKKKCFQCTQREDPVLHTQVCSILPKDMLILILLKHYWYCFIINQAVFIWLCHYKYFGVIFLTKSKASIALTHQVSIIFQYTLITK